MKKMPDKISITWCVDDVFAEAEVMKKKISLGQARWVLQAMLNHHDANLGISWGDVSYWIKRAIILSPTKKSKQKK